MTRAQHNPTSESRQLVQLHTTIGTPQAILADILGIDAKTLRKHYRTELDQSMAKANATIGGALFNKAKNGDTAAMIFWMKTRAQWQERQALEVSGKDGGPIQTEHTGDSVHDLNRRLDRIAATLAGAGDPEGAS